MFMASQFRRLVKPALFLALAALLVAQVLPEGDEGKRADPSTKVVPLQWLDEDQLLVRIGDERFLRANDGALSPSIAMPPLRSSTSGLGFQLTPKTDDTFITIEGQKHLVRRPDLNLRQAGLNQGFPPGNYIDVLTYLHDGEIGLIVFDPTGPRKIALPLQDGQNTSPPAVVQDRITGQFFAFQSGCRPEEASGFCTRSAWWLNQDLQVTSSFLLPKEDPLYTPEKFACFSCGCGCYTQEDVYAVNGTAYFQYSGFPLPLVQRGLYKARPQPGGTAIWEHLIKGQIEPPLAFSPSGCQVAYFQMSTRGDSLETMTLCQSPKGQP